jgi:hypothetical protein
MKLRTESEKIAAALKNKDVRVGDRQLPDGQRLRGVYARKFFAPGDYVASFHGSVVSREGLVELFKTDPALFARVVEYGVGHTPTGGHLYPDDVEELGGHLINHSCGPNADWAQYEKGALLVRAVKPIAAGQEITVHYGWVGVKAAVEKSWHPCACGAPFCTGTIELRVEYNDYDDGTSSTYLPPEEVAKRLLADIANDTDANEQLVHRYEQESVSMLHGAKVVAGFDRSAFLEKLQMGARVAVAAAGHGLKAGFKVSGRRLREIAVAYDVPEVTL